MNDIFMSEAFWESKDIFSEEDKRRSLSDIETIVRLSDTARSEGILALEEYVEDEEIDVFLGEGIKLIVDGTDPRLVERILKNFIKAGNYKGYEKLSRLIKLEGLLATQMGVEPRVMAWKMVSMLGEEYVCEAERMVEEVRERAKEERRQRRKLLESLESKERLEGSENFEKLVEMIKYPRDLVKIMVAQGSSESWYKDFAIALQGCSYAVIASVAGGLSFRREKLLLKELGITGDVTKDEILSKQNEILDMCISAETSDVWQATSISQGIFDELRKLRP